MSENSSNISSKGLLVSIFKYSIATWANALIYGVALLLSARLILPAEYSASFPAVMLHIPMAEFLLPG